MLAAFPGTAPWTGLCLANGLIGFVDPGVRRDPVRRGVSLPLATDRGGALPRTAIAVTVRNEDMRLVLPPLRRLLHELDRPVPAMHSPCSSCPTRRIRARRRPNEQAVAAFRAEDRDPARIRYRRRAANTGFKAGNVMDFLDHHADGFELMLALDADSEMSAAAVLRLVRAMQADPTLAIVQHLTVGLPASSAFPRLFQFGMRAGMRTWATGQAWWQGDEGPYWGHNAVVRIAPFRAHCRLPPLPGRPAHPVARPGRGSRAAQRRLGRAGVAGRGRLVGGEPAGAAGIPPPRTALAGRQHAVPAPAAPAGPAGDGTVAACAGDPAVRRGAALPAVPARRRGGGGDRRRVTVPRRAGAGADRRVARRALRAEAAGIRRGGAVAGQASRYGGLARFAGGAAAEFGFTLLLDAVSVAAKTGAMLRLAFGGRAGWTPQNRSDRGVAWGEAARLLWPQTALGVLVFAGFAAAGWTATLWALPLAGGLLAGDTALRADRRSALRPLAARPADRGDPGGTSLRPERPGGRAGLAATGRSD